MATGPLVLAVWFDDEGDEDYFDGDDYYCDDDDASPYIHVSQSTHTLRVQVTRVCLVLQKPGVPKTLL